MTVAIVLRMQRLPAARIAQLDVNRPNVWTAVVEEERTDIDKGAF
jgi:hypothetical protein